MKVGELRALLEAHGLRPQGRFGQNFLIDRALLEAIPTDAGLQAGEAVLEIGPGVGSLSQVLLARGAQLCAVEIDHGLVKLLQRRFAAELADGSFALIAGDALAAGERFHPQLEAWWQCQRQAPRIIANLPYAISGPFLARLPGRRLAGATLLLQREVAQKAAGPHGKEEWSPLSIRLALAFDARLGRRLPPEVFWPRPQVQSAFLHLQPRADALTAGQDQELARLLRLAFGQRRKRLLARLDQVGEPRWAEALAAVGASREDRPGVLSPAQWREALEQLS